MLALLCAPGASAGPTTAYNEPAFTKTSGNNSFWFRWNKRQSYDFNGNAFDSYYLCFTTTKDGVLAENHNGNAGPGSQNCTGNLAGSAGDYGVVPFTTGTVLQEGSSYYMCATGFFHYGFGASWTSDLPSPCTYSTTIDRSKPAVIVFTNGTDTYTNNPTLHHRIDYSDTISPAWQGQGSLAANYRCIKLGSPCTASDTFSYDPNCSVRTMSFNSRTNQFFCDTNVSGQSDGTWYFCAKAADAAIPDNTAGPNQFTYSNGQPVNSNTANISDAQCGSIILDRVPPSVTATASSTTVTVGDLVNFSASATDNSSGLAGGYAWNFGDNTQGASGSTTNHTYTQIGTFQARVTTQDAAGNPGTGTVNITVKAASSGPGGGSSSGGGGTVGAPPTSTQIVNQVGGGGTQKAAVGGLDVVAPKRLSTQVCKKKGGKRRCSRLKSLPMVLSPDDAGKVDLALVRGSRVVAKTAATFKFAGTFGLKMKLPRTLKAGRYSLRITYTPRSGAPSKKTLKLKVVAPKKKRAGRAVASSGRPRLSGRAPIGTDAVARRGAKRPIRAR